VLAALLELAPSGVEQVDGEDFVEYALYGAPGELPAFPEGEAEVGGVLVSVRGEPVADDWGERWKEFHEPVLVGDRIWVRPPWAEPREGALDLVIDPGQAFGTGAHPTTKLSLELMLDLEPSGSFADLGCGSGVLAIAAARAMPRAQVMASDNDPIAVEVARANADANGARRVVTACALGLEHPWLRQAAPFDLIIANILAGPLRMLAGDVARAVRPGGYVVLSGILNPEAPAVIAAYVAHGFQVLKRRQIGDWTTLTLRRRA
jgi:ribosomal protein L11 methyltransferase